jgi:hypothetical protein
MQINEIIAALFQFVDCVTPHPLNPHNRHFAIKPAGYSMIINHIAEDADYNFILGQKISVGSKAILKQES